MHSKSAQNDILPENKNKRCSCAVQKHFTGERTELTQVQGQQSQGTGCSFSFPSTFGTFLGREPRANGMEAAVDSPAQLEFQLGIILNNFGFISLKRGKWNVVLVCATLLIERVFSWLPLPQNQKWARFLCGCGWMVCSGWCQHLFLAQNACSQPSKTQWPKKKSRQQKQNKTEIPKNEKNKAEGNQKSRKTCQK